jgi:glycosyltransferase involved in cell wall biosynthesis
MDVVAHASIEPEPFGRVIVEGMAARKPVIATACGGPVEIVDDGVDGFLVPPGDVAAMARAMGVLASDPEARQRMGARAYAKAQARYGTAATVEGVLATYAALGVEA